MGSKRQTTVAIHTNVTADPGDDNILVDGYYAELIVDMKSLTGTSVVATAVELFDGGLTLPYDGQTSNFTVGATVKGYPISGGQSVVSGVIVGDADAGATGTLTLKDVKGKFEDNMIIRDDNATQGVALVNSATGGTPIKLAGGTWATVTATGAGLFVAPFELPGGSASDLDKVVPREFAIQYTFTAVTDADFAVDIAQIL
jgi:hypothetical protein